MLFQAIIMPGKAYELIRLLKMDLGFECVCVCVCVLVCVCMYERELKE